MHCNETFQFTLHLMINKAVNVIAQNAFLSNSHIALENEGRDREEGREGTKSRDSESAAMVHFGTQRFPSKTVQSVRAEFNYLLLFHAFVSSRKHDDLFRLLNEARPPISRLKQVFELGRPIKMKIFIKSFFL